MKLTVPDLTQTVPKTITVIGKFSSNLSLSRIFDVIPLFETPDFKAIAFKHEGLMREFSDGGVVRESDTEFKNSITMEIVDRECGKTRSVKIHCSGVHMCGNRSLPRARLLAELIVDIITRTDDFMTTCRAGGDAPWSRVSQHPFYEHMMPVIRSILPKNTNDLEDEKTKDKIIRFFRGIDESGGLFERRDRLDPLKLLSLNTVMINFSYSIEDYLTSHFHRFAKDSFLGKFIECVRTHEQTVFDIFINYDVLTSPMGWSGSVPLKFVHRGNKLEQWITLQMRRGTINNSGPTFEVMQDAVRILYEILDRCSGGGDSIVNVD